MIKIFSIVVSLALVFSSSIFIEENAQVSILPFVPAEVKPGDSFLVELTINKGNVKGFANLQQYLPEGFTATPVNSNKGSFSFKKQLVRFMWIELPSEKTFKISYRIKTDVSCNGVKTLNGEFSFIENNTTNKITITPAVVLLSNKFPPFVANNQSSASSVVEKMMVPSSAPTGGYNVTLKVKKGFQKIDVQLNIPLPEGYVAEVIDAHGGKFSFRERFAEFYWKTLPQDSLFNVSYHIFLDNPKAKGTSTAFQSTGGGSGSVSDKTTQASTQNSTTAYTPVPDALKGIYYKVQIAATRKSPDRTSDYFKSYWKIEEPVDMTMDDGWKKYLIGTFEKYSAAKQFGKETKTKIPDAFVVAYHSGVRIPLHEARKINQ